MYVAVYKQKPGTRYTVCVTIDHGLECFFLKPGKKDAHYIDVSHSLSMDTTSVEVRSWNQVLQLHTDVYIICVCTSYMNCDACCSAESR